MSSPMDRACKAVGNQAELARLLNVSAEAVRKWRMGRVPAERVLQIEKATKKKVSRHQLRPDLYPKDGEAA